MPCKRVFGVEGMMGCLLCTASWAVVCTSCRKRKVCGLLLCTAAVLLIISHHNFVTHTPGTGTKYCCVPGSWCVCFWPCPPSLTTSVPVDVDGVTCHHLGVSRRNGIITFFCGRVGCQMGRRTTATGNNNNNAAGEVLYRQKAEKAMAQVNRVFVVQVREVSRRDKPSWAARTAIRFGLVLGPCMRTRALIQTIIEAGGGRCMALRCWSVPCTVYVQVRTAVLFFFLVYSFISWRDFSVGGVGCCLFIFYFDLFLFIYFWFAFIFIFNIFFV